MAARKSAAEETRRRIVEAAMRLHSERGVLPTSWEDIAAQAGVAPATVYRHFPRLDDLIPACAQVAFDVARIPDPAEAEARFAPLPTPAARLRHLVGESCNCYARARDWLHAAQRERDLVPAMAAAVDRQDAALDALVRGALAGTPADDSVVRVIRVLVDFPFWKSLLDAGCPEEEVPEVMLRLVLDEVEAHERGPRRAPRGAIKRGAKSDGQADQG